jgi:YVTN family beta-propeller protein
MKLLVSWSGLLLTLALCLSGSAFAVSSVSIPVGEFPVAVAVNATTNRIYATNSGYASNSVSVIDGNTNTVIATVPVGNGPMALDVNPSTNMVYVGNTLDTTVSVIDGETNTVVATIEGMASPQAVAVNQRTNRIFVVNYLAGQVTEIDGASNEIIGTLPIAGQLSQGIALNTAQNLVYVSSGTTIFVIDGDTDTINGTFIVAGSLGLRQSLAYDAVSNRLFAIGSTEIGANVVYVLDAATGTVLGKITGSNANHFLFPICVTVFAPGSSVLISDNARNAVIPASETTFATQQAFHARNEPQLIAVNHKTGKFYVADFDAWTVLVFTP